MVELNPVQMREKFAAIKRRATEHGLIISRVPTLTRKRFIEISNEEFNSDYGMTLKWLIDFRDGILVSPNEKLTQEIDALAEEIAELKAKLSVQDAHTEKENTIRMASGRVITKSGG